MVPGAERRKFEGLQGWSGYSQYQSCFYFYFCFALQKLATDGKNSKIEGLHRLVFQGFLNESCHKVFMFTAALMRSPFSGVCSLKVFRNMDSRPSLQSRHHNFSWATSTELVTTAFVINRIVFVDEDEALCRLADLLNHCDCDVYSPQPHSTASEQISILQ